MYSLVLNGRNMISTSNSLGLFTIHQIQNVNCLLGNMPDSSLSLRIRRSARYLAFCEPEDKFLKASVPSYSQ